MRVKGLGLLSRAAVIALLLTLALSSLVSAETVVPGEPGGRPLFATLTGAAEIPGPGDPDGSGSAVVTLNQGQGMVCFDIEVADLDEIVNAHIHVGTADVAGPVVVGFDPVVNGLNNCVSGVDPDLIKDIRQNPQDYYVNVHTSTFPAGAIRGQLSK